TVFMAVLVQAEHHRGSRRTSIVDHAVRRQGNALLAPYQLCLEGILGAVFPDKHTAATGSKETRDVFDFVPGSRKCGQIEDSRRIHALRRTLNAVANPFCS